MQVDELYPYLQTLRLGVHKNERVPHADQDRQRREVEEILQRLMSQPGVILADEVGMGKTFVALAVAYCVAMTRRKGPVLVMVPPNLIDKWHQDLRTFCELYLEGVRPLHRRQATTAELARRGVLRFADARHSVELMKLLDDRPRERCHIIFLAQGAMSRRQTDKWVRMALIRETLRRHGRRKRLAQVKRQIHRFVGELIRAIGEQRASDWGDEIWQELLQSDPSQWMERYNETVTCDEAVLDDDPVPAAVAGAVSRIDLSAFADVLEEMPVRARGGSQRVSERIAEARAALKEVETALWKHVLTKARWKSPLLIMDEAHHLKNPATSLARQLQSPESHDDLRTGDGALARSFERMLFLTATPFQLGHHELVRVLERFADVRWDDATLGEKSDFQRRLGDLESSLTESQRSTISLQRCWSRLHAGDLATDGESPDEWWQRLARAEREKLTHRQRALLDAFAQAQRWRSEAQELLRPWLVRHNKGERWDSTDVARRERIVGAAVNAEQAEGGIVVPPEQLLAFFLAARSAVDPGKDLLGEALCSSYEAFRYTRQRGSSDKDEAQLTDSQDLSHSKWYLGEFDVALSGCTGAAHPKIMATVNKAVQLWEHGEKVLVFAFYRRTCGALRVHISREIEKRITALARRRMAGAGRATTDGEINRILDRIQNRYYDRPGAPGRQALDRALGAVVDRRWDDLRGAGFREHDRDTLLDVMRRYLRIATTLVRSFPIHQHDTLAPHLAVRSMLDSQDESGMSWRMKFERFIDFLVDRCSTAEREEYLHATARMRTGGIRVQTEDLADDEKGAGEDAAVALANVQVATGTTDRRTRSRLMRAFNTPFFPDILVCSRVMGEGIDLQRYCRHVIHHDLDWNPSSIEQRTGRVDRLGCKAEGQYPICVYLPYVAGAADERQYHVMSDREHWFRIVMGQEEVAALIPEDLDHGDRDVPSAFAESLSFHLELESA